MTPAEAAAVLALMKQQACENAQATGVQKQVLLAAQAEAASLREVLRWLDAQGGLGTEKHDRITAVLKGDTK